MSPATYQPSFPDPLDNDCMNLASAVLKYTFPVARDADGFSAVAVQYTNKPDPLQGICAHWQEPLDADNQCLRDHRQRCPSV